MVKHTRTTMNSKELIETSRSAIENEDTWELAEVGAKLQMQATYLQRDLARMQRELVEVTAAGKEVTAELKYQGDLLKIAQKYRFVGMGDRTRQ